MQPKFTIVFAYRNRDSKRVRLSLLSLKKQIQINFEVVFIDYGSMPYYSEGIKQVVDTFEYATYHYIGHNGLLWNKSKALNYGITKAQTETIFIADVDVIFAQNFSGLVENLMNSNQFHLFKIGYLPQSVTTEFIESSDFERLKPKHYGDTFGIGLFPKSALIKVGGLDEFFHFYGSEDEDLNFRLISAGYKMCRCEENILLHQWHERYPRKTKENLTVTPRLSNIQRINQRHFLRHKENQKAVLNETRKRRYYNKSDYKILEKPTKIITIENIEAHVVHYLNFELPHRKNDIIKLIVKESTYYKSLKYNIKTVLKKQAQPYLSMKQVNDLVLQKIIFNYRDFNYAYEISEDLKTILFSIDLKNNHES